MDLQLILYILTTNFIHLLTNPPKPTNKTTTNGLKVVTPHSALHKNQLIRVIFNILMPYFSWIQGFTNESLIEFPVELLEQHIIKLYNQHPNKTQDTHTLLRIAIAQLKTFTRKAQERVPCNKKSYIFTYGEKKANGGRDTFTTLIRTYINNN